MVKIKNLALLDRKKLVKLNSFLEAELGFLELNPFFVDFFHNLLPFRFKFLDESFVSIENKKINGLITINKAGNKRVKIKRLFLDENAYEIGKILVNYVISRYLTKGVEAFYVVADKTNINLITMFKNGCGFQSVSSEIVYKIENETSFIAKEINFNHIRKMKLNDVGRVANLYDTVMHSYKKPFFLKKEKEVEKELIKNREKYVIYEENNSIIGFFSIDRLNKEEYLLDFVISSGFEGYAADIIEFTKAKLLKKTDFKTLYVKLKSHYSNFDELAEIFNMEYQKIKENDILYKGFLTLQKQEIKFEKMIFNDITPAF